MVKEITSSLQSFITKWATLCKIDSSNFELFYNTVLKVILKKINQLKHGYRAAYAPPLLEQENIRHILDKLHKQFVFVPIDKAGNNFGIICRKLYIDTLKHELGIVNGQVLGNNVYRPVNIDLDGLIHNHYRILQDHNIRMKKENKTIPLLYCTSKLHKNPYKFRFIAGAATATLKQLSIELSLVLQSIKELSYSHIKSTLLIRLLLLYIMFYLKLMCSLVLIYSNRLQVSQWVMLQALYLLTCTCHGANLILCLTLPKLILIRRDS